MRVGEAVGGIQGGVSDLRFSDFESYIIFPAELGEVFRRLTINHQGINLGDVSDSDRGITAELHYIRHHYNVTGVGNDCLGDADLTEIVVEQQSIFIDGRDANDSIVYLELGYEIHSCHTNNTSIGAPYHAASYNQFDTR